MKVMSPPICDWSLKDLRLAYFDFTVRGEGAAEVVRAVLIRWHQLAFLCEGDLVRWMDALEWREGGGFLPGWTIPPETPSSIRADVAHGELDTLRFEHWRARRHLASSA